MHREDDRRAGAAILKELALFNKAAIFFEDRIEPVIRAEISKLVAGWLKNNNWRGNGDVSKALADIQLWPPNWEEEVDDPYATISLVRKVRDGANSYEIADLFGVGQSSYGFRFVAAYGWFRKRKGWVEFIKGEGALVDGVAKKGWQHEGGGVFFLPVTLPAGQLVTAWETDDWNEALVPLEQALEKLGNDVDVFNRLIMRAKPRSA